MNHAPKPDAGHATFTDGDLAVRLSFPPEQARAWRAATVDAIVDHLGFAVRTDAVKPRPNGTDAARLEP